MSRRIAIKDGIGKLHLGSPPKNPHHPAAPDLILKCDSPGAASGAFLELLEESFARWSLTPSERDVALLAVKGLSIGEIARLRQTREGTDKAQCTAVYRKAGVNNRAQLLSLFVEELMAGVTLD